MATGDRNICGRIGKDDSVELDDYMKSYSPCWVSTRRECKTKAESDNYTNGKVNVMPSNACENIHSLLENEDNTPCDIKIGDEISCQVLLPVAKSDSALNPYIMFDKGDSLPLTRVPEKDDLNSNEITSELLSNQFSIAQDQNEEQKDDLLTISNYSERVDLSHRNENDLSVKNQMHLENQEKNMNNIRIQDSGCVKPSDFLKTTKNKNILSENGKMVAEMDVTSLLISDQEGRYFPVTIKYVWETDASEILNSSSNINETSKAFIKTIETSPAFGMEGITRNIKKECKENKHYNLHNSQRNKDRSTLGWFKKKRQEISIDDKEQEKANSELAENKNDLSREAKSKTRIHRSRLSVTTPALNRKSLVSPEDERDKVKNIDDCKYTAFTKQYSRPAFGRERSRCLIETRTTSSNKIGKTFRCPQKNVLGELNQPSSPQGISSMFKKHSAVGHSQHKPPSAPTRESPSRPSGKMGINTEENFTGFAHKQFGFKKTMNHLAKTGRKFAWK